MATIADVKKYAKALADDNTRYYGKWNSSTGNGKWNVPSGYESYPPTFDCGLACTWAIYKALGWSWNSGTTCAWKGYIWPDNEGTSNHEWFMVSLLGAKKYSYSDIGYNGLKDGDILDSKSHIWMMYDKSAGTIFEANDGYSSNKAKQIDIHGWINYGPVWVYRLPWESGESEDPTPAKKVTRFNMEDIWTVQKGGDGGYVASLQALLNAKMDAGLLVDGNCGDLTVKAIKKWQKKYGLYVDGIAGPITQNDIYCRDVR